MSQHWLRKLRGIDGSGLDKVGELFGRGDVVEGDSAGGGGTGVHYLHPHVGLDDARLPGNGSLLDNGALSYNLNRGLGVVELPDNYGRTGHDNGMQLFDDRRWLLLKSAVHPTRPTLRSEVLLALAKVPLGFLLELALHCAGVAVRVVLVLHEGHPGYVVERGVETGLGPSLEVQRVGAVRSVVGGHLVITLETIGLIEVGSSRVEGTARRPHLFLVVFGCELFDELIGPFSKLGLMHRKIEYYTHQKSLEFDIISVTCPFSKQLR